MLSRRLRFAQRVCLKRLTERHEVGCPHRRNNSANAELLSAKPLATILADQIDGPKFGVKLIRNR